MSRTSAKALCTAVVCLTLAGIPAAEAARPSAAAKREAAERAARKACLAGDYTTAMSILSDLFVEIPFITSCAAKMGFCMFLAGTMAGGTVACH